MIILCVLIAMICVFVSLIAAVRISTFARLEEQVEEVENDLDAKIIKIEFEKKYIKSQKKLEEFYRKKNKCIYGEKEELE